MNVSLTSSDALIVVDVQNDFCPGGALPAPEGDKVVPSMNAYIQRFHEEGLPIAASRDWHPEDHMSFRKEGGPWPPHCIQGSQGAEYHPDLSLPEETHHVKKGTRADEEDYSAFLGHPSLTAFLHENDVDRIFVGGLTTEYCVKETVLDALEEGFDVLVLDDATQGVNVEHGDANKALEEMRSQGARVITSTDIEP